MEHVRCNLKMFAFTENVRFLGWGELYLFLGGGTLDGEIK